MAIIISGTNGITDGDFDYEDEINNKAKTADVGVANSELVKTALNATGTAPIYACRAWVNFNGTGTVAIRASENVSSITDNGVGTYTVNFITAMTDTNYCINGCTSFNENPYSLILSNGIRSTTSVVVGTRDGANAIADGNPISVSIIR